MSGVAGVVHLDGSPVQREALDPLLQSISYRGPDGIDVYAEGPIALAQLWLRTTPESQHETAPFICESGAVVVGDVRLDNRGDLAGLLGITARSASESSTGDLELVGRAFDRWGTGAIPRLLGDFALAIWDRRERTLHLARDAFGIRPLCWALVGETFVFSSQPSGVLSHPAVPETLDDRAIADQLMIRTSDADRTYFSHVHSLPPAHTVSVTGRGVVGPTRYWDLPADELRLTSDEQYEEMFRELLVEAVRSRMRTVGRVGFELSGGLDSASVVGAARHLLGDDVTMRTYGVSLGGDRDPDPLHRDAMVDYASTIHLQLPIESAFDRSVVRETFGVPDEPYTLEGPVFQGAEYLAAVGDGVRVLLGGMQGDAVVLHGYPYLVDLLLAGSWPRLASELRMSARNLGDPVNRVLRGWVIRPLLPARILEVKDQLFGPRRGNRGGQLASDDFLRRLGMKRHASWLPATTRLPALRTAQRDLLQDVARDGLMSILDTWSARAGLELRHPYTDRRILEFCYALPGSQHFQEGWPRWIQRRGIEGLVPDSVRWRVDKGGFAPDFQWRMLSLDWDELTRIAATGGSIDRYVDLSRLRRVYANASRRDPSSVAGPLLWVLWLDRFVKIWT